MMKNIKMNRQDLITEYYRFCSDMLYIPKNKDVIRDFAAAFLEHYIGCFGFFENDFFIVKDINKARDEIIKELEGGIL